MHKVIFILLLAGTLIQGCAVTKKKSELKDAEFSGGAMVRNIGSIVENNLSNYDFFIPKAEINIIQNNVSVRFIASIRFRRPDSILITVKTKSGIEAGRALITSDTILINDRINKKLMIGSPGTIGPKYGIEPALLFVLFGDMIVDKGERTTIMNCSKGIYEENFKRDGKEIRYKIDCDKGKAVGAYFEGDIRSGNITLFFTDIVKDGNIKYPRKIEARDDLNSLTILTEIKKIECPWYGKVTFHGGQGYKVVKIR